MKNLVVTGTMVLTITMTLAMVLAMTWGLDAVGCMNTRLFLPIGGRLMGRLIKLFGHVL